MNKNIYYPNIYFKKLFYIQIDYVFIIKQRIIYLFSNRITPNRLRISIFPIRINKISDSVKLLCRSDLEF